MLTITRAGQAIGSAGEPLPTVFQSLAGQTVHIRRAQVTLIAAGPGVGKSVMAMTLAAKAGVPAYYFSADTDSFTMRNRVAAMVTGHSLGDVEDAYKERKGGYYDVALNAHAGHIRWHFERHLTLDAIDAEVNAFAMVYGEYPHLIVVDNLKNVYDDSDGEPISKEEILDWLHQLSGQTNAAVVVLHHLVGQFDSGMEPPPLDALLEKVSKTPELVLCLYRAGRDAMDPLLGVCVDKNRTGKADPSGGMVIYLDYDAPHMRLTSI